MKRKRWQYYVAKHKVSRQWSVVRVEYGTKVTEDILPAFSVAIGPHRTKRGAHYMALARTLGGGDITAREADRLACESANSRLAKALKADPEIR